MRGDRDIFLLVRRRRRHRRRRRLSELERMDETTVVPESLGQGHFEWGALIMVFLLIPTEARLEFEITL